MGKNSGRLSTGRKNRGVISRQFRRLNIISQTTRGRGRREGAGCVCDCRDRKKQRRTEGESAKTYRTHFIKKSFFLLLNFNIYNFSFLFNVQCSHTLLECHMIVFKCTTNPCSHKQEDSYSCRKT